MRSAQPTDDRDTGAKRPIPSALRTLLRLPRHLYAHDLGWILGERFLQLAHTGRSSGRRHTAVLEVVGRTPAGELVVVSGRAAQLPLVALLPAAPASTSTDTGDKR